MFDIHGGRTVRVNGTTLYYEEVGRGPSCLVLHGGFGIDHTAYHGLDRLSRRRRLIYFDQRGNGRSGRPPLETLTITQLADDAAALATRLDTGPVVVLGHSMGGYVAQELAYRRPDLVAGLVLIGTTPGQLGTTDRRPDGTLDDQGPPLPLEVAEAVASQPRSDTEFAEMVRKFLPYFVHRIDPADLGEQFSRTIFDAAAKRRSLQVLDSWSMADRLSAVTVRTLVAVGRYDVFAAPAQAYRIARRIAGSEVVVFERSGHFPWVEEPTEFFAVVSRWMDGLPAVPHTNGGRPVGRQVSDRT